MIRRSYNPQLNNPIIHSKFDIRGGSQCGYTSFGCALSEKTNNDEFVLDIGSRMENPGELRTYLLNKMKLSETNQRLGAFGESYYWVAKYLNESKEFLNDSIFIKSKGKLEDIKMYIDSGYAIFLSTMLVPSGHFIVVVDYTGEGFICKDPAGKWKPQPPNFGYFNNEGNDVHYLWKDHKEHFCPDIGPYFGGFRGTAIKEL